jgi:hypothetical protein
MSFDVYCAPDALDFSDCGNFEVVFGPEGPRGAPGSSAGFARLAALTLGGQRVLKDMGDGLTAGYADPSYIGDAELILGVSQAAANGGAIVNIQSAGDMVDPAWSWSVGAPIYCGLSGALVQTPPSGNWVRQIGVAVQATRMIIAMQPPVFTP